MTNKDRAQLSLEIKHILCSGANEERLMIMVENFIDKRYTLKNIPSSQRIIQADERKRLLDDYTNWLWYQHNDLTNAEKNKTALELYLSSNGG